MNKDIASSFNKNIELVDKYRYYYSHEKRVSLFEKLKLAKMVDNRLKKYDKSLWARVQQESEELVESPEYDRSDNLFFAGFFSYLLFYMVFATCARVYFPKTVDIVFILFVGLFILFVAFVFKIAVPKWKWSFRKIFKLRNLVQELINNAIEFFREEGLDPVEYPLTLRFKDYNGLKLVKEKRKLLVKEYVFCLDLSVINTSEFIEKEISEEKICGNVLKFFIKALIQGALIIVVIFSLVILLHRYGILKL